MQHHVIVRFDKDTQYEYRFAGGAAADQARQWFDREFTALECDVATPTGKVLVVDRILAVAKYGGADRFRDQGAWGDQFARHAAAILGRELIRVDVEHFSIGY